MIGYGLLRSALFGLSPHTSHRLALDALAFVEQHPAALSLVAHLAGAPDPRLRTRVMGLDFPSPIGLAGGFDKNAEAPGALAALGFGFLELGTVTAQAQEANPEPNLFRLPDDRALINRLGFPNDGAATVTRRFAAGRRPPVPVGFSIGKSRSVPLDPRVDAHRRLPGELRGGAPARRFRRGERVLAEHRGPAGPADGRRGPRSLRRAAGRQPTARSQAAAGEGGARSRGRRLRRAARGG